MTKQVGAQILVKINLIYDVLNNKKL
jgi:hypothetical protein